MRIFRDLLLAILAGMVALGLLEGGLRVAQVRFNARLYEPQKDRGYGLRPGGEGWNVDQSDVYVRINREGLRDVARPVARPVDTLRVAVIGSCEAEARTVPLEQTFESVMRLRLESALAQRATHVDVLNFGVTGHTISQQYLTLRDRVFQYDPQVVVLVQQLYNYLKNTRDLFPGNKHETPFYRLENGKLVPDEITRHTLTPEARAVARRNLTADLMNMSHVAGLANSARLELTKQWAEWRGKLAIGSAAAAGPVRPDFEYLRYVPDRPEAQESWAIGDALVDMMKAECDRRGVEFRIVTVDGNEATNPDAGAREAFRNSMDVPTLDAAERRVEGFCRTHGIPIVLPSAEMLAYAETHHTCLRGDPKKADNQGYWNAEGQQVMGQIIARDLLENSGAVRNWAPAQR